MEEVHIAATRGQQGYQFTAYDAAELFGKATDLLNQQQCRQAVELYDKVVAEFPGSGYAAASAYNAGLCLQALGDFSGSAERYRRARQAYVEPPDQRDASFQLSEVLVQLEGWDELLTVTDALLAVSELTPPERLEAMARHSQGLLGKKRLDDAESYARGALSYFHTRPPQEAIRDEFFAAACQYVVAETYRERQDALVFPADPAGQKQVLLRRAEVLLRAQQEYLTVIGFKNLDNFYWAAAAGYRLGAMYEGFWHAVTEAPVPKGVPESAKPGYRAELAALLRPLMRNALRYWEATQLSMDRTGMNGAWRDKIEAGLARVRALILDESRHGGVERPANADTPAERAQPPVAPQAPPNVSHRAAKPAIAPPAPSH